MIGLILLFIGVAILSLLSLAIKTGQGTGSNRGGDYSDMGWLAMILVSLVVGFGFVSVGLVWACLSLRTLL